MNLVDPIYQFADIGAFIAIALFSFNKRQRLDKPISIARATYSKSIVADNILQLLGPLSFLQLEAMMS